MLPFVVLIVVVVYLLLDRSGVIDDFAESMRRRQGGPSGRVTRTPTRRKTDEDVDSRLEVFQNFIEKLQSPEDEDDSTTP